MPPLPITTRLSSLWLQGVSLVTQRIYCPLGRKVMTNLDNILKSRDITLSTKVHLVKAMVFPVVMYGCESWTIKKAECQRIDAFELWCWRRLLRVPWTAKRSKQSILKEISPGCSLEGLMLKLKLQYFGHLIWRTGSLEKTLMLGGIGVRWEGDDRGWDGWMASMTQRTWVWVNSGSWWWTGRPGVLWFMRSQRAGHDWATELNCILPIYLQVVKSDTHTSLDWLLLFHKIEKMSFLPFLWSIYVKCSLYNSGPLETSDNKCVWLWSFCFH